MLSPNTILILIFVFPLLGAVVNGFALRKAPNTAIVSVGVLAIAIPFVLSLILFFNHIWNGEVVHAHIINWITLSLDKPSDVPIALGLTADRLSGLLLLVVTGIGSLIHLYSGEYMSHEKGVYRFFTYLNLFVFSMLALILGSNMLTTFLGWEGVGLCSYLLIGYWFEEEKNAAAGMKAFLVNRIGDFGFIMAMFIALNLFGTLDYSSLSGSKGLTEIVAALPPEWFSQNATMITLMGLSILLAVTGKSAQMPLYIWLPDAMAGPTPVSALIHAATMVTAGVYFMTRMSFLLVHSPLAMATIASIGAATALFAATIGFVQTDIKKVLAYSTVSQLGFMVLACGVGAFQFGIAHLVTHAFFKALLFLGAGSVIYAMHHEQDILKMGGLWKKMPITATTFVIGTLAIIGFPLMSGFMSKDEILFNAFAGPFGHPVFWVLGVLAAAGTAFYMTRLTYLTFFGKTRADHHTFEHARENNWLITVPLSVLAFFSIFGGIISIPAPIGHILGLHGENFVTQWLEPILSNAQLTMSSLQAAHEHSTTLEWSLMGASTGIMFAMVGIAVTIYRSGPEGGAKFSNALGGFYRLVFDKWRIDELYGILFVKPLSVFANGCYRVGDLLIVEGLVNGVPQAIKNVTQVASDFHGGFLRTYAKFMYLGVLILAAILFWSMI